MLPKYLYEPLDTSNPDPILDQSVVLALARRHVSRADSVVKVDETGGQARAYHIDDDLIFKTQRPHRLNLSRTSLEKEVFFLRQLAPYPDINVPKVLGYGQEGFVEYILMTRMPGVALRNAALNEAELREALLAIGRWLGRLHAIAQEPFVELLSFPGDRSHEDLSKRIETSVEQAVDAIAREPGIWDLDIAPEKVAEKVVRMMPSSGARVALHSNPRGEHAFVDPDTKKFIGVIDFGDAFISHPSFDFRTWFRYQDRLGLLAGYTDEGRLDDDFMTNWLPVMLMWDMTMMTRRPQWRTDALNNLRLLLKPD